MGVNVYFLLLEKARTKTLGYTQYPSIHFPFLKLLTCYVIRKTIIVALWPCTQQIQHIKLLMVGGGEKQQHLTLLAKALSAFSFS